MLEKARRAWGSWWWLWSGGLSLIPKSFLKLLLLLSGFSAWKPMVIVWLATRNVPSFKKPSVLDKNFSEHLMENISDREYFSSEKNCFFISKGVTRFKNIVLLEMDIVVESTGERIHLYLVVLLQNHLNHMHILLTSNRERPWRSTEIKVKFLLWALHLLPHLV